MATSRNHDPAAPLQSEVAPEPRAAEGGNKEPNEGTLMLTTSQKVSVVRPNRRCTFTTKGSSRGFLPQPAGAVRHAGQGQKPLFLLSELTG